MSAPGLGHPDAPGADEPAGRLGRRRSRGQALVEVALVLPLFLLLLLGLFDAGRVVYTQNAISEAAREAVRTAAVSPSLTQTKYDSIRNRALSASIAVPVAAADVTGETGGACTGGTNDATAPGTCFYPDSNTSVNAGERVVVIVSVRVDLITPIVANVFGGAFNLTARSEGLVQCTGC
jgi:Flp pilus assembly protein TadG